MQMNRWRLPAKNERKIFRNYLTRYLLIVLVVILCCIPFGFKAYQSIEEFVLAQNLREIEDGIKALNHDVEKMSIIATLMGEDTYLLDLARIRGDVPGSKSLHMKYIKENLFDNLCLYDTASMAFFMFRNNQVVVTASQVSNHYEDFYGKFLSVDDLTQEAFREKVFNQVNQSPYLKTDQVMYYDRGNKIIKNDVILYLQPVAVDSSFANCPAVMVFIIEKQRFLEFLLPGDLASTAALKLTDRAGNEMLNTGPADAFDAKGYELLNYPNEACGLSILVGYPLRTIYQTLADIASLLIFYVLGGCLVAVILTVIWTLHWFKPYKKMMGELSLLADDTLTEKNEYDYIRESILKLVSDKDELETKMLLANNEKQAIMLENLFVSGFSDPAQKEQFLQEFPSVAKGYYVVQLIIHQIEEAADCQLSLLYAMEVFSRESKNPFLQVYPRNNMAIVLVSDEMGTGEEGLKETLQFTLEMVIAAHKIMFMAGISQRQENVDKINVAYAQARQTVNAYETKRVSCVASWQTGYEKDKSCFHIDNCRKLYDLLLYGHREAIGEVFREMKEENGLFSEKYSFQKLEIYHAILFVINSACQQMAIPLASVDSYTNVELNAMTLEECLNRLEQNAYDICDMVIQKKDDKHKDLKMRLMQYLDENFNRPELTASLAAREVDTSEKYVYSFVKEQTGKTFSNYLDDLRMAYAKERLKNSEWSNERIAEAAGFGSVNSFYRVFKKDTGVSPNIYRQSKQDF